MSPTGLVSRADRGPRLVMEDRGPWTFALYWFSFHFRTCNEPPRRAMSFFGLSSTLRSILLENERTAPLARRFDFRSRVLMVVCLIPGMVCLSGCIILSGLPQPMALSLRDQFPTLGATLLGLSLLALALMAIVTRDMYRSFKALFETYNAIETADEPDPAASAARLDAVNASGLPATPATPVQPEEPLPPKSGEQAANA